MKFSDSQNISLFPGNLWFSSGSVHAHSLSQWLASLAPALFPPTDPVWGSTMPNSERCKQLIMKNGLVRFDWMFTCQMPDSNQVWIPQGCCFCIFYSLKNGWNNLHRQKTFKYSAGLTMWTFLLHRKGVPPTSIAVPSRGGEACQCCKIYKKHKISQETVAHFLSEECPDEAKESSSFFSWCQIISQSSIGMCFFLLYTPSFPLVET